MSSIGSAQVRPVGVLGVWPELSLVGRKIFDDVLGFRSVIFVAVRLCSRCAGTGTGKGGVALGSVEGRVVLSTKRGWCCRTSGCSVGSAPGIPSWCWQSSSSGESWLCRSKYLQPPGRRCLFGRHLPDGTNCTRMSAAGEQSSARWDN